VANAGYVVAGYLITVIALGGYTLSLFRRASRARERVRRVVAERGGDGRHSAR
jgi:CcmD family protein